MSSELKTEKSSDESNSKNSSKSECSIKIKKGKSNNHKSSKDDDDSDKSSAKRSEGTPVVSNTIPADHISHPCENVLTNLAMLLWGFAQVEKTEPSDMDFLKEQMDSP